MVWKCPSVLIRRRLDRYQILRMRSSRLLSDLAKAFEFLPGIGPKSAQRLAFHMMDGNKDKSLFLSFEPPTILKTGLGS